MTDQLITQQEFRSAVVFDFVSRLGDVGKIKTQKLAFLLQSKFDVPLGCNFYLHQFGPYADEVENTISNLRVMGYISVEPDSSGYGFHLKASGQPEAAWEAILTSVREPMDRVLNEFGNVDAREIELVATLVYVRSLDVELGKDDVVKEVRLLKPKFSQDYISRKYEELQSKQIL